MKVTLYPTRLSLLDDNHDHVVTILAYEAAGRVNVENLPQGWQRCAWRDNGGSGDDDTIESGVTVNHMCDYITQFDVSTLLMKNEGWLYMGPYGRLERDDKPIEMDSSIYDRN